jgi:hypothetical protein
MSECRSVIRDLSDLISFILQAGDLRTYQPFGKLNICSSECLVFGKLQTRNIKVFTFKEEIKFYVNHFILFKKIYNDLKKEIIKHAFMVLKKFDAKEINF